MMEGLTGRRADARNVLTCCDSECVRRSESQREIKSGTQGRGGRVIAAVCLSGDGPGCAGAQTRTKL